MRRPEEPPAGLVLVGHIGKPHGISGEVYVLKISDDARHFETGAELTRAAGQPLTIGSVRAHRDRFLVKFEGIQTRSDAELLRGALYAPPGARRSLEEDELWADDLIGSSVSTVSGAVVGTITDVVSGVAQDLLIVQTPDGECMVPLVKDFLVRIDTETRNVTLDVPPGLLD